MHHAHLPFTYFAPRRFAGWHWLNAGGTLLFVGSDRPDAIDYGHAVASAAPPQTVARLPLPPGRRYALAARSVAPSGVVEHNRHVHVIVHT